MSIAAHNVVAAAMWSVAGIYALYRTIKELHGAAHYLFEMVLVVLFAAGVRWLFYAADGEVPRIAAAIGEGGFVHDVAAMVDGGMSIFDQAQAASEAALALAKSYLK